ncbi:MAG: aldehyde dehydrogenase [Acidobacteria bacterium]|nr:MAG: aldehyde dehydrogenase [Acidobacteriota bacterium]
MKIVNPATGETLRDLAADSPDAVAGKVEKARRAQAEWARTPLDQRRKAIAVFAGILEKNKDDLAARLTSEMGKPITQSRNELTALQSRLRFFLDNVEKAIAEEVVHEKEAWREVITYEPLGLVGNISAWNYPYFVGSNVFVPALLTGNAVLYKPSEFATLTGLAITDAMHAAGVPAAVFAPVVGGGEAGRALVEQPLDAVFFTGSYATGRQIAEAAAPRLMKVQLELGGKDPVYVADDVDVVAAAKATADGAFYNTGQSCCAVERVYVHERIHDAFVDAFVAAVEGFVVGDPMDEETYIGPVAREAHLRVLEEQVADAKARGARLRLGGERLDRPGFYFAPTVFADARPTMALMRDETFGPLIGIQKVKDDEEALRLMNDTEYGLTAGVYTRDEPRARRLLAGASSGSAYWNCCDRVSPRLPWTGRRHSGLGVTLGFAGLRAFVQPRAWHLRQPK